MREHRYSVLLPHSPERLWALMHDYERWTDYAPMVLRVELLHPGDKAGQGLLRRVIYRLPFGREGSALELVTQTEPCRGYTFKMISRHPGNDQTGRISLERLGTNRTRLHFEERYNLKAWPWRWFEGPIYRFINRKNEQSIQGMSKWLSDHPEYRPELVEPAEPSAGPDTP